MLWFSVTLLALFASVQGRAVNISNTWVLPEEGFPVFYRYFRDRISWYEADAVCQFHHANLVTGSWETGILGAVDCTHVKIFPPPLPHAVQYLNRKGVHTLNVQLIADVNCKIISVNARFPGRVHDSFIFSNFAVKAELKRLHDSHIGEYFLLVDTTAQYDAVRAYLKELDISSAVWVGLIRSNPDGDFTWTDYRGLSGDGYWSSAPDTRAAPLCAAADPAADYRWEARACGGPTVASFICELPVPQWALGKEGCMVRALPALTALYLPESAAVQLTADCGLAGVKRVQCTGNVKREELLKDLSCNDEDDPSSTISSTSTSTIWPATETTFNDQETSTDYISTAGNVVTEQSTINSTPAPKIDTPFPYSLHTETEIPTSTKVNLNIHNFIRIPLNKDIYLEQIHSNDIPQPEHQENPVNNHHLKTIEENKSYHHRLLHDEMTRLGNLETIFTQPTDHFVPPLVMAKARISDDMTVLSLEKKHAQQIAEHRLYKHNKLVNHVSITPLDTSTNSISSSTITPTIIINDQKSTQAPISNTSAKKDLKSSLPKKYIDKYSNIKAKSWKTADYKIQKASKIDVASTSQALSSTKEIEAASAKLQTEFQSSSDEDPRIDLTVIINEPGVGNRQQIFYSNHTNTLLRSEQVTNLTGPTTNQPDVNSTTTEMPILTTNAVTTEEKSQGISSVTLNHEVNKITVINDNKNSENSSPVVFEVSTLTPFFHNNSAEVMPYSTATVSNNTTSSTIKNDSVTYSTISPINSSSTQTQQVDLEDDENSSSVLTYSNNIIINNETVISTTQSLVTSQETPTEAANLAANTLIENVKITENVTATVYSTAAATIKEVSTTEKLLFNHTDNFEEEHEHEEHNTELIDDYQSPLLSAANEPLHRPNRSRRPLPPPNRINKFNPFRILG